MTADNNGRPWNWTDDASDTIVPQQPPIACYLNTGDQIVLRQRGDCFNDDAWIWLNTNHAAALATAILELAGLDIADLAPEPAPCAIKPRDATGAERQRRRRARQKEPMLAIDPGQDRDVTVEARDSVTRDGEAA